MCEPIVRPLDGSDHVSKALPINLAKKHDARLPLVDVLLHGVETAALKRFAESERLIKTAAAESVYLRDQQSVFSSLPGR